METITFYSYKGGTGRTLAVANTALFLARRKRKVFILDLDLEAPGLHYKFGLRNGDANKSSLRGLVDFIHDFTRTRSVPELAPYVSSVPHSEFIRLMPAGNAPSPEYSEQLAEIKLAELFNPVIATTAGAPPSVPIAVPLFLELKKRIELNYSPHYLLIDSRTGVTEIGGIAVRLMPDTLVCLVHNNDENIAGARRVLRNVQATSRPDRNKAIDIVVALARIPEMLFKPEKQLKDEIKEQFNEKSDNPEETLQLQDVLVLHSDPNLQLKETLLIGSDTTANESVLLRDYYKLFRILGFEKILREDERAVLTTVAEIDSNEKVRPLTIGSRRLSGESSIKPIDMRERCLSGKQRLKVVNPAYLKGKKYDKFIEEVLKHLIGKLPGNLEKDPLPENDVHWDLLAVHLREGVLDFCSDIYYLTENRSHLVEVVQLGWCYTFKVCMDADSPTYQKLETDACKTDLECLHDLMTQNQTYVIGVRGDTPAASETNRRLSPVLKSEQLVSKGSDEELEEWLAKSERTHKIVACDHVIANKLKGNYSSLECKFEYPIPVGIVYPREDRHWRKDLSRAITDSLVEFLAQDNWDGVPPLDSVARDFKDAGLTALSLDDLRSSLLLDLPFEEAVKWNSKIQAALDKKPSAVSR